ncbi:MAG TPA: CmcJ/NvfI family oxidoreductase [Burkholderiales bacterium]|nr:CmcJ/NvfI family oxidoreductase [Burkholderiales bacterium]
MFTDAVEELSTVVAQLGYLGGTSTRPYDYAYTPPAGVPWKNYLSDTRPVRITDARGLESAPTLSREGFRLCDVPTALSDFVDEAAIKSVYYPEAAELARAVTGAKAAYVFDHLVRKREPGARALTFGRRVAGDKPSANGCVHNDYTEASGPRRMALVLGEKVIEPSRYAIVNIWRPINGPVLDAPLALCDARTIVSADLVASDVHYATRTGEIYLVKYSPRHRWFYFPEMERNEALIFKQYDSLAAAPRFVPHAAFDHPHTPPNAPLRESIEARCLVVFA